MALNTSLSDMPWLGQPADPGGSLARGVATGATIAGVRNQRAALSQRKFEFEQQQRLAQAQEERAAALMPLQQTLMKQEAAMGAEKLASVMQTRQDLINNEADLFRLNTDIARSFTETDNGYANSITMMREALAKNPKLVTDPRFIEQRKMLDEAMKLQIDLAQVQNAADRLRFTVEPEIQVRTNPLTGEQVAMVRRGPTTWQPLPRTTDAQDAANKQAVTTLQKQIDIINKKRIDLDPTAKDFAEKRLQMLGEANALQRKINKINQGETLTTMEPEPTVEPMVEPKQVGGFRILRIK